MIRYLMRRLLQVILLFFAVAVLTFILIHLAPGDPIAFLAGERSTAEFQAQLRHDLGLDQPVQVQLERYLSRLALGDMGYSFSFHQPVLALILARVPATLLLVGASVVLSMVLGVWIGVQTAVHARSLGWNVVTVASLIGYSLPSFWLGQVLILLFAVSLNWFPIVGMTSLAGYIGARHWLDVAQHLVLPVTTLTAFNLALIARLTRASMLEVLEQDYMLAARGKGLSSRIVIYRHGLRNALLPVITVLGLHLGSMIAGVVLVETVFGWPGLGRLTHDAIMARDYPVVSGMFLFVSESVILANLATDLIYGLIDPRIRYG